MAAALLLAAAACASGQDPQISPSPASGPSTTSRTLSPCPDGGPDATTPPAGCLDDHGNVLLP